MIHCKNKPDWYKEVPKGKFFCITQYKGYNPDGTYTTSKTIFNVYKHASKRFMKQLYWIVESYQQLGGYKLEFWNA